MKHQRFAGVVLGIWLLLPTSIGAQTPTAEFSLFTPDPADCTIAPLSDDQIQGLVSSTSGNASPVVPVETPNTEAATPTPFVAPVGTPVSAEVEQEVSDVVSMFYACQNAGDPLRWYALLTDAYLARTIEAGMIDPSVFATQGTPVRPRTTAEMITIGINGVTEVEPNVYSAEVSVLEGTTGEESLEYVVVVREGDVLRIDDVTPLS